MRPTTSSSGAPRRMTARSCSAFSRPARPRWEASATSTPSPSTRGRLAPMAASSRGSTPRRSGSSSMPRGTGSTTRAKTFWPKRYAIWGRLIAEQPGQSAFVIFDEKVRRPVHPAPLSAAARLQRGGSRNRTRAVARRCSRRWRRSTRACARDRPFDPAILDGVATAGDRPAQEQLGAADRHAAVLRVPAAAGDHVHLPRAEGGRDDLGHRPGRAAVRERVRGGRDHGRQHPRPSGTSPGSGSRLAPCSDASPGEEAADRCSSTRSLEEANRQLTVCNACRYCEGYCAVFPALERRIEVVDADVLYIANLCHDCRACYYACPFTDPHEFAIDLPRVLSEVGSTPTRGTARWTSSGGPRRRAGGP